jgi:hypothetical protein
MASHSIHSTKNGDGLDTDVKDEKEKNDRSTSAETPPGPPKKTFLQRMDLDVITILLMVKCVKHRFFASLLTHRRAALPPLIIFGMFQSNSVASILGSLGYLSAISMFLRGITDWN